MVWARFDDRYSESSKIIEAGPLAELLDMRAIIYCCRNETDGVVSFTALQRISHDIPNIKARAKRLVEIGRWDLRPGGGWVIHDFLEYNPSKAEIDAKREHDRRRVALNRDPVITKAVKSRDGDRCRYCGVPVSWTDRRGKAGATYDHVIPRGPNSVDNVVVACRSCNAMKGRRTPEEAGMKLRDLGRISSEPETTIGNVRVGSGQEQEKEQREAVAPTWVRQGMSRAEWLAAGKPEVESA